MDLAPPGAFPNLDAALAAARRGARIRVRPGRYRGSARLDKSLEILGDGPKSQIVIAGAGDGHVVDVRAGTAVLRGLTLRGPAGVPVVRVEGGQLTLGTSDVAHEPATAGAAPCIAAGGGALIVRDSRVHGCSGEGVHLSSGSAATLERVEIEGAGGHGICVDSGCSPTLTACRILGSKGAGILLQPGAAGIFPENLVARSGTDGIVARSPAGATFRGNRMVDCRGNGIVPMGAGDSLFKANDVTGNRKAGVLSLDGARATLIGNRIGGNDLGLLDDGSVDLTLDGNDFTGNQRGGGFRSSMSGRTAPTR